MTNIHELCQYLLWTVAAVCVPHRHGSAVRGVDEAQREGAAGEAPADRP